MTFLGADLSLTRSGIVVLSEAGAVLWRDSIQPKTKGPARLKAIATGLVDAIRGHSAEEVAIEAPFTGSGPMMHVALHLAELHGAVKVALLDAGIKPPYYVAPTTLKKFATGSGKGEKSAVQLNVYKKWGQDFGSNDEADAYVLARIAGAIQGAFKTTGYEAECVKTIKKSPTNEARAS